MEDNKTHIYINWETRSTYCVINLPTKIVYNFQTGGILCESKECEGVLLDLGSVFQDFKSTDCTYACGELDHYNETKYIKLIEEKFNILNEHTRMALIFKVGLSCFEPEKICLDHDRIKELIEGWWPIKLIGKKFHDQNESQETEFIGYIHLGNCD